MQEAIAMKSKEKLKQMIKEERAALNEKNAFAAGELKQVTGGRSVNVSAERMPFFMVGG